MGAHVEKRAQAVVQKHKALPLARTSNFAVLTNMAHPSRCWSPVRFLNLPTYPSLASSGSRTLEKHETSCKHRTSGLQCSSSSMTIPSRRLPSWQVAWRGVGKRKVVST